MEAPVWGGVGRTELPLLPDTSQGLYYLPGEGQATSISHPPSSMLQMLSSRQVQPRGGWFHSSNEPLPIGQKLSPRYSRLIKLGLQLSSSQLFFRAEVPQREIQVQKTRDHCPHPVPCLWNRIITPREVGHCPCHSSRAESQRFCPREEAGDENREAWSSSKRDWLYLEQSMKKFKLQRVLVNNGEFNEKQVRRSW